REPARLLAAGGRGRVQVNAVVEIERVVAAGGKAQRPSVGRPGQATILILTTGHSDGVAAVDVDHEQVGRAVGDPADTVEARPEARDAPRLLVLLLFFAVALFVAVAPQERQACAVR